MNRFSRTSFLILLIACVGIQSSPHAEENHQPESLNSQIVTTNDEVAAQDSRVLAVEKFCDGYTDAYNKIIGDKQYTDSTNSTIDVSFFETAEFVCRIVKQLSSNGVTMISASPLDYFCDNILQAPTDYFVDKNGIEHFPSKDWISLTLTSDQLCIDFKRDMQSSQSSQS